MTTAAATAPSKPPAPSSPALHPVGGSLVGSVVLYGTFGLLAFGPLAFGAVQAWSMATLEIGAAALLMLWIAQQVRAGELHLGFNPVFAPLLSFGALILLQIVFRRTAYRYQTISELQLYAAYAALCFLAVQCLRRTSQVKNLTVAASCYGSAIAAFALLQGISSNGRLYWLRTPESGGWIYGPYVNHNHYAGLMELLIPIPLVFTLTSAARGRRRLMAAGAAALMCCTLFLSGSRGGITAFVAQMVLLAILSFRKQPYRKTLLAAGVFLLVVAAASAWLGGAELTERMASIHSEAQAELSGGTRISIARDSVQMFLARPILGWGLGAFPFVYPEYRSFYTNFFVNAAHNDYVQLLVETGAAGFTIAIWFLVTVFVKAGKKVANWTHDTNGAVTVAAILGATGILVHSPFDFNLHIPANAALFYVLCTIAAMESRFGITRRTLRKHPPLVAEVMSTQPD